MVTFYVNTIILCILLQMCSLVTTVFEDLLMLINIVLVHSFNYTIVFYCITKNHLSICLLMNFNFLFFPFEDDVAMKI